MVDTLERAVKQHPRMIFIACHLANCCADLNRLGAMLDKYLNLYIDIGARYAELSPIPRTVRRNEMERQLAVTATRHNGEGLFASTDARN